MPYSYSKQVVIGILRKTKKPTRILLKIPGTKNDYVEIKAKTDLIYAIEDTAEETKCDIEIAPDGTIYINRINM